MFPSSPWLCWLMGSSCSCFCNEVITFMHSASFAMLIPSQRSIFDWLWTWGGWHQVRWHFCISYHWDMRFKTKKNGFVSYAFLPSISLINSIFTELYMVLMEQVSCSNRMLNKGVAEGTWEKNLFIGETLLGKFACLLSLDSSISL